MANRVVFFGRPENQARRPRHRALRGARARPPRAAVPGALHTDARRGVEFPGSSRDHRRRVRSQGHAGRGRGEEEGHVRGACLILMSGEGGRRVVGQDMLCGLRGLGRVSVERGWLVGALDDLRLGR